MQALVSVAAALLFGVLFFFVVRSLRVVPKGGKTKSRRTWLQRLRPSSAGGRQDGHSRLGSTTIEVQNVSQDPEPGVDRHTSIRSVATLPAYSAMPHEGEGVIGREGDREGMDTVLEFPETAEEEEGRRELEMESLWRIRTQRREEAAEREERRRRRREARARGDTATLTAIRRESLLRTTLRQANGSAAMITEYHSRPREPRVSAVNYGDLGVARHDGSRVRANSTESDSSPLLDGAAGTGMAGPVRPWMSHESPAPYSTHHRMSSDTSMLSMSSVDSDDRPANSREASDFDGTSLQHTRSRALSQPRSRSLSLSIQQPAADADLGESRIPLPDPPRYESMAFEDAPPYEPATASVPLPSSPSPPSSPPPPQLPTIDRLPSIRITEYSPADQTSRLAAPSASTGATTAPIIHEETI